MNDITENKLTTLIGEPESIAESVAFYQLQIEKNSSDITNYWHLGMAYLYQGNEPAAQDVWVSALLQGTLEESERWTQELLKFLESNSFEQLKAGNYPVAKKCYELAKEIDDNYRNESLEAILFHRPEYFQHCQARGYQFSTDWLSHNILIWKQALSKFASAPNLNFLEIGSWEGRTACWLFDNILTHESARLTCIDTFEGIAERQWLDEHFLRLDEHFLNSLESVFDFNIALTGAKNRVTKKIGFSQEILRQLALNTYDFLYIDGSHLAPDVLEDAVLGWRLVKVGGIIIFDDYQWTEFRDCPTYHPKLAVDAFLTVFRDKIKVLYQGYQVVIEKTAR